ncbi:hypothetical protein PQX77_016935 [Marasmius sp. AFHP31]|nr:hypothetical protein PQX77_016935 [Marasmius sp. AFHP31]
MPGILEVYQSSRTEMARALWRSMGDQFTPTVLGDQHEGKPDDATSVVGQFEVAVDLYHNHNAFLNHSLLTIAMAAAAVAGDVPEQALAGHLVQTLTLSCRSSALSQIPDYIFLDLVGQDIQDLSDLKSFELADLHKRRGGATLARMNRGNVMLAAWPSARLSWSSSLTLLASGTKLTRRSLR